MFILTPGYITGLTQSDGSFSCGISIIDKRLINFRPVFQITVDLNSKHVLDSIISYFGCGKLTIDSLRHTATYQVTKKTDLLNIIIPHFNSFPLFCAKLHAFNLFQLILENLNKNIHKEI